MGLHMQKGRLFFSTFLLLLIGLAAHAQEGNTIYWTANTKLQFDDFKGRRVPGDPSYLAKTAATVVPKVTYGKDSVHYKIDCVFEKHNSVIKRHSGDVLEHEQGHFDITEVVARMIRKNLSGLSAKNGITESVSAIVEAAYQEGDRIQQAYEADCGYGDVPARQAAWNKRIREMLDGLKDYDKAEGAVRLN